MNMTVVIVTRPMEFLLLLVLALACLAPLACLASEDRLQVIADESRDLDDDQLGSIVAELGGQLEGDMENEMDKLMRELEAKREKRGLSDEELERLKQANRLAGQDIRARVEMAGDNAGALPQWSLGDKASSFLSATSQRLTAASSYVGNKLRSMGASVARKMPKKLRRLFKWPTFMAFKVRHHKIYKSVREELYRQMVFLRTHVKVGMQHLRFLLRRDRHLLGANQYADMTQDEIYTALNNEDLEAEKRELSETSTPAERERTMAQLQKLASAKKNIFGAEVDAPAKSEHHLRKRSAGHDGDDDDDDDELDADEEDFHNIGLDFGADNKSGTTGDDDDDDEMLDDEESFKLVDEFANADLSGLDELDNNLDAALNGANQGLGDSTKPFEPIDLRKTGCIIRSENQNKCGNCYSQAVTAMSSYYNCMRDNEGKPTRYNPFFPSTCGQYMFEEGKPKWINGCQGGRVSEVIRFVKTVGLPRFSDYNVAMVSAHVLDKDQCAYPRPSGSIEEHGWPVKLNQVDHLQNSQYTMLQLDEVDLHLRTVGPVLVNIRTWENFEFYEAGIYNGKDDLQKAMLHSMMIVGHDRDPVSGLEYYIIWNSAGINWGENGYLRVSAESLEYFLLMLVGLPPKNID